jgi:uncharacterized damage-inducible protein DinB
MHYYGGLKKMPGSLQTFLARAIAKANADLEAALMRLPEDKRSWAPAETSRTPMNQVAEVALIGQCIADTIENRQYPASFTMDEYMRQIKILEQDWREIRKQLSQATSRITAALQSVTDDDLKSEIKTPFGVLTLEQVVSYPYWNACYHEGQINYIASMRGCLK